MPSLKNYSKLSYIHNPGTEPLRPLTIGKLLERTTQKYGDRLAIISRAQRQRLTFREVLIKADKLAAGLATIGLKPGDRVGIWAPNLAEWYITHMACARGGYILVNINPAYQPLELQSCINSVGARALVSTHKFKKANFYQYLIELAPEITKCVPGKLKLSAMPTLETVIVHSTENLKGTFNFYDIVNLAPDSEVKKIQAFQENINPDEVAHLQFTSGTTGKPKAPMQTHFHIVNNSYYIGKRSELDSKHHIICMLVPFFHAFGTVITLCSALNYGATIVLPAPGYDADRALDAVRDEKCTMIFGTPTMYVDLITRQKIRKEEIDPEIAVSGGACCSPHLFREMKDILKLRKVKVS